MSHVDHRLPDLLIGSIAAPERAAIEAHLDVCPTCAERWRELAGAAASLSLAPAEAAPRPDLRARIFGSLEHLNRFSRFAPIVAELVDVPLVRARRALFALSRVHEWAEGPWPGMRVHPAPLGSGRAGMAIFTCFAPDASLPRHRHLGPEVVTVFEGAFEDSDGRVVGPGDVLRKEPGSSHAIVRMLGGIPCLALIVTEGFELE